MDLQSIFYVVAIITMLLFIVLTISVIYFLFFLKKVIEETRSTIVGKILEYTKPVDVFKGLTSSIIGNVLMKLRDSFGFR